MSRTRAQSFDDLVLESVEAIERHIETSEGLSLSELRGVEFAVEDVPGAITANDSDVLEDRSVPLARLVTKPGGGKGKSRIIIYRRPLELRAHGPEETADLVRNVLIEQVANLLGIRPDEIDPS